jgi:hypothetical protein
MSVIKTKKASDNVVIFPKSKANVPPMTIEELNEKLKCSKLEVADHLAEELTHEVGRIMSDNGYMITHVADLAFLLITVKAVLLRHEKIYHPVQDFIDENIILTEGDEDEEDEKTIDIET